MREGNLNVCWDSWSIGCVLTWNKLRREVQLVAPCKFKPWGFSFSGEANTTVADSTARRASRNCIMGFVTAVNNEESIKLGGERDDRSLHIQAARWWKYSRGGVKIYDHEKIVACLWGAAKKATVRPIRNFGSYFSLLWKKKGSVGGQ